MKSFFRFSANENILPYGKALFILALTFLLTAPGYAQLNATNTSERGFFDGFVTLRSKNANPVIYDLNPQTSTANTDFNGVSLGSFFPGEALVIRSGEIKTYKNSGCDIFNDTYLYYYVHPDGTTGQVPLQQYTGIKLNFNRNIGSNGDQQWGDANAELNTTNILTGLTQGSYVIDVFISTFVASCNNTSLNGLFYYSNQSANYQAQFTVLAAPLPVSLTAFNAAKQSHNALLTWETASETNNKGYEVQSSVDGKTFRTLGFVASQAEGGNSTTRHNYRFLDTEAKSGVRYYRLRQLDLDGKENFYGPKVLNFDKAATGLLTAAPNPFDGEVTLSFPALTAARTGTVTLIDALGRTALTQNVTLDAGTSQTTLPALQQLPKGMYYLRLNLGGEVQTAKLVKQ